ncbi:hypothetical protein ALC60_01498, partial [Trachymyrmex zeteki]
IRKALTFAASDGVSHDPNRICRCSDSVDRRNALRECWQSEIPPQPEVLPKKSGCCPQPPSIVDRSRFIMSPRANTVGKPVNYPACYTSCNNHHHHHHHHHHYRLALFYDQSEIPETNEMSFSHIAK